MQRPSETRIHATARRVDKAAGWITTRALTQMADTLPWFESMPAAARSLVGVLVQSGVRGFGGWMQHPDSGPQITSDVFAMAPRDLARVVSLERTVELVRVAVDVTESAIAEFSPVDQQEWVREQVLRYSREIAFAAAMVYARAAEQRGAWDARLEALVVDALIRGDVSDSLLSRASALGWSTPEQVVAIAGQAPVGDTERVLAHVRRIGADAGLDVLAGVQSARLMILVGATGRTGQQAAELFVSTFAEGPVVVGPVVDGLRAATLSVRDTLSALRAAPAWPGAPRPVDSGALLVERALAGDHRAELSMVEQIVTPLSADQALLSTADTYIDCGGSIEASARRLFIHANTVRYRLRRVADLTGYDLAVPRDRFVLHVALTLGRLDRASQLADRTDDAAPVVGIL